MKILLNEKGFTFLEMCMVVAIISVLMVIAVPNYQKAVVNAQSKSCEANRKLMETQVDSYYLDTNSYPTGNTSAILSELKTSGYLKDIPKCPSNGNYTINIDPSNHAVNVTCSAHLVPSP